MVIRKILSPLLLYNFGPTRFQSRTELMIHICNLQISPTDCCKIKDKYIYYVFLLKRYQKDAKKDSII